MSLSLPITGVLCIVPCREISDCDWYSSFEMHMYWMIRKIVLPMYYECSQTIMIFIVDREIVWVIIWLKSKNCFPFDWTVSSRLDSTPRLINHDMHSISWAESNVFHPNDTLDAITRTYLDHVSAYACASPESSVVYVSLSKSSVKVTSNIFHNRSEWFTYSNELRIQLLHLYLIAFLWHSFYSLYVWFDLFDLIPLWHMTILLPFLTTRYVSWLQVLSL